MHRYSMSTFNFDSVVMTNYFFAARNMKFGKERDLSCQHA